MTSVGFSFPHNGPTGHYFMTWDASGLGLPDMGNSGPFRGALGEATEGSIRTFAFIRWPGKDRGKARFG